MLRGEEDLLIRVCGPRRFRQISSLSAKPAPDDKFRHTQKPKKDNVLKRLYLVPGLREIMQRELRGYSGHKTYGFRGLQTSGVQWGLTIYCPDEVHIKRLQMRSDRFPIRFRDLQCPETLHLPDPGTGDLPSVSGVRAYKINTLQQYTLDEGTLTAISTPPNFVIAVSNKAT